MQGHGVAVVGEVQEDDLAVRQPVEPQRVGRAGRGHVQGAPGRSRTATAARPPIVVVAPTTVAGLAGSGSSAAKVAGRVKARERAEVAVGRGGLDEGADQLAGGPGRRSPTARRRGRRRRRRRRRSGSTWTVWPEVLIVAVPPRSPASRTSTTYASAPRTAVPVTCTDGAAAKAACAACSHCWPVMPAVDAAARWQRRSTRSGSGRRWTTRPACHRDRGWARHRAGTAREAGVGPAGGEQSPRRRRGRPTDEQRGPSRRATEAPPSPFPCADETLPAITLGRARGDRREACRDEACRGYAGRHATPAEPAAARRGAGVPTRRRRRDRHGRGLRGPLAAARGAGLAQPPRPVRRPGARRRGAARAALGARAGGRRVRRRGHPAERPGPVGARRGAARPVLPGRRATCPPGSSSTAARWRAGRPTGRRSGALVHEVVVEQVAHLLGLTPEQVDPGTARS